MQLTKIAQLISDEGQLGYRKRGEAMWRAVLSVSQFAFGDVELAARFLGARATTYRSKDGAPIFRACVEGIAAIRAMAKMRPFVTNEVTRAKVDCILSLGASVLSEMHPFLTCGAVSRGGALVFQKVRQRQEVEFNRLKNQVEVARRTRTENIAAIIALGRAGKSLKEIQRYFPKKSPSSIAGILVRNNVSLRKVRAEQTAR